MSPLVPSTSACRRGGVALALALTVLFLFLLGAFAGNATADDEPAAGGADGIGVTEHLGEALPSNVTFRDHTGRAVRLGDYFDGRRPAVLIFGYHTCPMLCSLVQNATAEALREIGWVVGREFDVIVISIDPSDTPAIAARKRAAIVARYEAGRPHGGAGVAATDDGGWHYLTGDAAAIRAAADAAGFHFRYDPDAKQFAHPAVVLLTSPKGRITRYLYGLDIRASDVRYGLLEAAAGRSVTTLDRVLLYCMHFDPGSGRYTVVVGRVMAVGGAVTATALGTLLLSLSLIERRRRSREARAAA